MTTAKTGQKMESNKQMGGGCMAGLFNFSHLLSGKRFYLKRLPPPPLPSSGPGNSTSAPVSSDKSLLPKAPEPELRSQDPAPKSPLQAVSTFEFKEPVKSPWKFARETPRLSLDSRAVVDATGGLRPREIKTSAGDEESLNENQRRGSPCVIARLMGLELPPSSEAKKKMELRRSASESRSRDYRFLDNHSFLSPTSGENEVAGERKSDQLTANRTSNIENNTVKSNARMKNRNQNQNRINQRRLMSDRKNYYNTADFFPPELPAKQQGETIYGEIERRLRMRGIDEPSNDLETLKHILEALQLKGLLHSSATPPPRRHPVSYGESPIVVMTPARAAPLPPPPLNCRGLHNYSGEPSMSPRRDRPVRTPGRRDYRSSSPPVRRKGGPLSVETQRKSCHSPVQSPKTTRSDRTANRSPRGRRSTVENCRGERFSRRGPADDEASSTISESSFSTSSHTENERWRGVEYREGRSLLERCDKLLHSIAEMNSNPNPNLPSAELQQPSPVSVLDSSFYKDEESPSPVKMRSIEFKDQVVPELEDDLWSPSSLSPSSSSTTQLPSYADLHHGLDSSSLDDPDIIYISEVLRASNCLSDEPDMFLLLEKQLSIRGNKDENCKISFLRRKLIFDTITEILNRTGDLPPRKSGPERPTLHQIWAEFQRIREPTLAQDLFEVIVGVLKKDLAQDWVTGWGDCPVEMSEAVLDIERLIFKDLIGESIGDLAALAGLNMGAQKYRRKLVF